MAKKTLLFIGSVILFFSVMHMITAYTHSFIPKYEFYTDKDGNINTRCNKYDGTVECYSYSTSRWVIK